MTSANVKMSKEMYDRYAKVLFMDNLSDDEIKDLIIAYNKGGYASLGPLFTGG